MSSCFFLQIVTTTGESYFSNKIQGKTESETTSFDVLERALKNVIKTKVDLMKLEFQLQATSIINEVNKPNFVTRANTNIDKAKKRHGKIKKRILRNCRRLQREVFRTIKDLVS